MQIAIKREILVLPGGRIELEIPELKAGTHAEVVILLAEQDRKPQTFSSITGKGKGAFSTPKEADDFLRKERDTWES